MTDWIDELFTFDPRDLRRIYQQDFLLRERTDDTPMEMTIPRAAIRAMPDSEFAAYLRHARAVPLLPVCDGLRELGARHATWCEAEAQRRVHLAEKRARAARYADSWATADFLAEVEAVCGPGRKAGKQVWFRCPWHEDSTPSLEVDPARRLWHAFCCGRSGGVLDWRREIAAARVA